MEDVVPLLEDNMNEDFFHTSTPSWQVAIGKDKGLHPSQQQTKKVGPLCEYVIFDFLSKRVKKHYYLKHKKILFLDTDLL
jgi:hypothetical protein